MKKMVFVFLTLALTACGASDPGDLIWSLSSQRIIIVQDNGNVLHSEERYITYDYSLDSLSANSKNKLSSIRTISTRLTCQEDGTSYKLTITDGSGIGRVYYSNNTACNDTSELYFIETKDITTLIALLTS